jgi:hypothetical protein
MVKVVSLVDLVVTFSPRLSLVRRLTLRPPPRD